MKLLVINGPNINMLGLREPGIYGSDSYDDLVSLIGGKAQSMNITVHTYQSNYEGSIVDKIQAAYGIYDGIIINPAALTHYSIAVLDALKAVAIPAVEVHISDIASREEFRHKSVTASACISQIAGHGFDGYLMAIDTLVSHIGAKHV